MMKNQRIYFDNAATTPLHPEVKQAMTEAMERFGNPASIHAEGRRSRVMIEDMRITVAGILGVTPSEVFFTSGGTESLQTALTGALRDLGVKRIVSTPLEHPAVLQNLKCLNNQFRFDTEYVRFDSQGRIDTEHLQNILGSEHKTMVVLMHANNETGMLLPLNKIAKLCNNHNALFLSDTVQTIGKFDINLSEDISFAAASAHKFHGPKGTGLLFVNGKNTINPLILGGGQERNMRSGTENIIGIAGITKALEVAVRDLDSVKTHIESLRDAMAARIRELVPEAVLLTNTEHSLYTILNVGFPTERTGEMLVYRLDMEGVAVSGGSACASGVNHPSHVLQALDVKPGFEHVRFSFSRFNSFDEVEMCISQLRKMLR